VTALALEDAKEAVAHPAANGGPLQMTVIQPLYARFDVKRAMVAQSRPVAVTSSARRPNDHAIERPRFKARIPPPSRTAAMFFSTSIAALESSCARPANGTLWHRAPPVGRLTSPFDQITSPTLDDVTQALGAFSTAAENVGTLSSTRHLTKSQAYV
jgi:hypothetical protein